VREKEMRFCTKCVMPDTRPGITFDGEGVCQACRNYERRRTIDWGQRQRELELLCSKHRRGGAGGYDCLIAVSGGKDSHYQTHVMKEEMGMNPLLATVEDNFPMTKAGISNLKNLSEAFGCDIVSLKPNIRAQKAAMRKTFERYGKLTWYIDRLIYTYPLHVAVNWGIPLVVYGENVSYEYGGAQQQETYSARQQIENGVASDIPFAELIGENVSEDDLNLLCPPAAESMRRLEPIYLSYFFNWNSYANCLYATTRGFKDLTHEWERTHHIECFDQVDSRAYLVHAWMKYPKFGHASATDYASRFVRYGLISREEAVQLVRSHDHRLDPRSVDDFCDFVGYSKTQFWQIVDRFYDREIFRKNEHGEWVLKMPVWA
jgi:N-acetyl sugar amidotransferase